MSSTDEADAKMVEFAIVNPDDVDAEPFPESGLLHRKLTGPLQCSAMRLNTVTLAPGEQTAPHTHERQEEVYVALDGGHVQLNGNVHELSPRGIVRIAPAVERSVRNDTGDTDQTWLMIGAPPHGTVEDFGEYRMPRPDENE